MKEKILVRAPNWIGDQILAFPFFHYLRELYPRAHIVSVCVPWVEAIQYRGLVDQVHVLQKSVIKPSFMQKISAIENEAQALKGKGPWDRAFILPTSISSAWMMLRVGAKERIGYEGDGRGLLLTRKLSAHLLEQSHRADSYLSLLPQKPSIGATDFWGAEAENDLDPPIPGVVPHFLAEREWPKAEPVQPPEEPYWVLAPGSNAESRRWPVEHFIALARIIATETQFRGLIVGGPAEAALADRLCEDRSLKLKDLTAQGSAASYWRVFRSAKFTVANDSGLGHIAALCGSPVQVVWGAGNPKRTEPIGPGKVRVIFNPIDCWPCEKNQCHRVSGMKLECLKGISPDAVWNEIKMGFKP